MESTAGNRIKVGIFVTIGLIVVLGSIVMLGGDRLLFSRSVSLHAQFDQVQGLAAGSVVSLSGVTVGNVKEINFLPEQNKLDVVMKIYSQFLPRITEGATVEIRTQGALGDKFVYIIPGRPDAKALKDGDAMAAEKATDLMGIIAEKGDEAKKVFDIISEVHKLMKSLNEDNRTEKIMSNFAEVSQNLKVMTTEMKNQNTPKIKEAIDRMTNIMAKIDRGEGTLGALINDPSVHDSLKSMLGSSARKKSVKSLLRNSIEKSEEH